MNQQICLSIEGREGKLLYINKLADLFRAKLGPQRYICPVLLRFVQPSPPSPALARLPVMTSRSPSHDGVFALHSTLYGREHCAILLKTKANSTPLLLHKGARVCAMWSGRLQTRLLQFARPRSTPGLDDCLTLVSRMEVMDIGYTLYFL